MDIEEIIRIIKYLDNHDYPFRKQIRKGLRELIETKMTKDRIDVGGYIIEKKYNPRLDREIVAIYTKESHKKAQDYLKDENI